MAIITLIPIIESISGRDGDAVHYRRGNTNCLRVYVEQDNPDTDLQRHNRSLFSMAVRSWRELAAEVKEVYAERAVDLNMSGYNLYLSEYMKAGAYRKYDNNAGKLNAGTAESSCGHGRLSCASASLLLRFSFASASISPLTCRLPVPKSTLSGENRGIIPP